MTRLQSTRTWTGGSKDIFFDIEDIEGFKMIMNNEKNDEQCIITIVSWHIQFSPEVADMPWQVNRHCIPEDCWVALNGKAMRLEFPCLMKLDASDFLCSVFGLESLARAQLTTATATTIATRQTTKIDKACLRSFVWSVWSSDPHIFSSPWGLRLVRAHGPTSRGPHHHPGLGRQGCLKVFQRDSQGRQEPWLSDIRCPNLRSVEFL